MIQGYVEHIMTDFDHRITSATSEGLNSKIQTIKELLWLPQSGSLEDGHFHCGGLKFYPVRSSKKA